MRHKRRPSAIVLLVSNPQGLRILPSNDRRTISDLGKTTVKLTESLDRNLAVACRREYLKTI